MGTTTILTHIIGHYLKKKQYHLYNDTLLCTTSTWDTLYMYNISSKQISDWNTDMQNNNNNNNNYIPKNLLSQSQNDIHFIIPINNHKCILCTLNLFYIIDLDFKIPKESIVYPNHNTTINTTLEERNCIICKRYNNIILNRLCDPMERKRYGT